MKAKATLDNKNDIWSMVISAGNVNGGIILSSQLLYEAPASGYQPNLTLTSKDKMNMNNMYLYVKSRDPAVYSRIHIYDLLVTNTAFALRDSGSVTNPYGDRNLEAATGIPYEVLKKLLDHVKAFGINQRPPRPDLSKLIENEEKKKPFLQRFFKQ